jgi:recombination protein RecR
MIDQLPHLAAFLKHLQQVPYVASKNLFRVAHHFLEMDAHRAEAFSNALLTLHTMLTRCSVCFAWQERSGSCLFCASSSRNRHVVCVVERWHDLYAIEKSGGYQGLYHVLGGVIHPLDGISAEDLTIAPLIERMKNGDHGEMILALNQTPEGEVTASYIAHKLKDTPITLTRLARGVPVGGSLEFTDRLTVQRALSERRPF